MTSAVSLGGDLTDLTAMRRFGVKHNLQPVNGQYMMTPAMIAEDEAIDKANGDPGPSPEAKEDLWRLARGLPPLHHDTGKRSTLSGTLITVSYVKQRGR